LQPRGEATEEATGVARRRIEVNDVVEVLVQWQTGRRVKQIARSTGLARNTVRKYLAQVTSRAGLSGSRRCREPSCGPR
jgi:response regulator of citrate/malate metabolism